MKTKLAHLSSNLYKKTFLYKITGVFCTCVMLACLMWGCTLPDTAKNKSVSDTVIAFDTVVTITLYGTTDEAALKHAIDMCYSYEQMFSRTVETSDIYRINHSNGAPVTVQPETLYLIKESLRYSEQTNGAVDITIAPVRDLWDFTESDKTEASNTVVPSAEELSKALQNVDYRCIKIDETTNTVTLENPQAQLDLGFIAKGYIADEIKKYLVSQGISSAIINLGGNVLTVGNKPDGSPFVIGIEKPFETTAALDTVSVSDKSIVTSGIYQRCFVADDVIYHHILDPKTGYPVQNDLLSVTIISDSSMEGDALSTSCLLLGMEQSKELLSQHEDAEAVFVTSDYKIITLQ